MNPHESGPRVRRLIVSRVDLEERLGLPQGMVVTRVEETAPVRVTALGEIELYVYWPGFEPLLEGTTIPRIMFADLDRVVKGGGA